MRTQILSAALLATTFSCPACTLAQNTDGKHPPVIDIHVHTLGGIPGVGPMCPFNPQFLASDPQSKESPFGWSKQDCAESARGLKNARGIHEGSAGRV